MDKKPEPAADLAEKLAAFENHIFNLRTRMLILWWQRHDDPALASLGGGVVTLTVPTHGVLLVSGDFHVPDPIRAKPQIIARDDVLDLRYVNADERNFGDAIHKFMADFKQGQHETPAPVMRGTPGVI